MVLLAFWAVTPPFHPLPQGRVLAEIRERLWGLLCPITLHRRASDVDLSTMRATTTNLNLFDHFSAASNEDG